MHVWHRRPGRRLCQNHRGMPVGCLIPCKALPTEWTSHYTERATLYEINYSSGCLHLTKSMMKCALAFSRRHRAGIAFTVLFAYLSVSAAQSARNMEDSREIRLAASVHSIQLSSTPVRVELVSEQGGRNSSLEKMIESLPASKAIYLVLTGLHAEKQPGTLFHLYLDLPEGTTPEPNNAWHVGSINFYGAVPVPDAPKDRPRSPSFSIDITEFLHTLRSSQKLTPATTLTITPTHPPEAGSKPMIGQISMIAK